MAAGEAMSQQVGEQMVRSSKDLLEIVKGYSSLIGVLPDLSTVVYKNKELTPQDIDPCICLIAWEKLNDTDVTVLVAVKKPSEGWQYCRYDRYPYGRFRVHRAAKSVLGDRLGE